MGHHLVVRGGAGNGVPWVDPGPPPELRGPGRDVDPEGAGPVQAGDGEAAEAAMLAIVRESSTAVETVRALETLTNSAQIIDEMVRENRSR